MRWTIRTAAGAATYQHSPGRARSHWTCAVCGRHTDVVEVERGVYGSLPYAAVGDGPPLVVFAGLMPVTGVGGDAVVKSALHPLLPLAAWRRLVLFNRRAGLPRGMTMAELAGEHAEALRDAFAAPVDLVGTSTGGSIAAQLSADHGALV